MVEKISFIENIKIFIRAIKVLNNLSRLCLPLQVIRALLGSIIPYVSIIMSSKIISELVSDKRKDILLFYIFTTVGVTLLLVIAKQVLDYFYEKVRKAIEVGHQSMLNEKTFSLDFSVAEKKETNELRQFIETADRSSGSGLRALLGYSASFMKNLFSFIIAFTLLSEMVRKTNELIENSNYSSINSSVFTVCFIVLLILMFCLLIHIEIIVNKKELSYYMYNTKFNLIFDFYKETYLDENKAAKDIRIFSQKDFILKEINENALVPHFNLMHEMLKAEGNLNIVNVTIIALFGALVYIFVALKAYNGEVAVGDIIKYYGAITQLIQAFSSSIFLVITSFNNNEYVKKLFIYLDLPDRISTNNINMNNYNYQENIVLNNVYFRYDEKLPFVLKNINLSIKRGERVAIVGSNGSGKSSLIKLICRLYDVTSGEVTLGNNNINDMDVTRYKQLFSVVFQDFKLFALPIAQNIAGSIKYDENNVWNVIQLSGLEERVKNFPMKLEQTIYKDYEEDGIDVSGGEEQKIAIARALFKNSSFVILDEPTASLDPFSEAEIYEKFDQIIGDKTAIFISHRLSSCKFCDRIIVLEKGVIVQQGTHTELLENKQGKYFELWNAQAQYYMAHNYN